MLSIGTDARRSHARASPVVGSKVLRQMTGGSEGGDDRQEDLLEVATFFDARGRTVADRREATSAEIHRLDSAGSAIQRVYVEIQPTGEGNMLALDEVVTALDWASTPEAADVVAQGDLCKAETWDLRVYPTWEPVTTVDELLIALCAGPSLDSQVAALVGIQKSTAWTAAPAALKTDVARWLARHSPPREGPS